MAEVILFAAIGAGVLAALLVAGLYWLVANVSLKNPNNQKDK